MKVVLFRLCKLGTLFELFPAPFYHPWGSGVWKGSQVYQQIDTESRFYGRRPLGVQKR